MNTRAAKPKASAGSTSGDMNSGSKPRAQPPPDREIARAAAVPKVVDTTVAQNATTRLVQAACCIWVALSSAVYHRRDSPSGGKRKDCEAVSDVSKTITLGPTRKTTAMPVRAANSARSDSDSQSTRTLARCIGPGPCELVQQGDDDQEGTHEDHRDSRGKRPVTRAYRLLIAMQRTLGQPAA